ncbi:hypothetical protein OC835_001931 [Tilletia horrida]|nr:hypothetical protein OC835_001931 [Tilletia horrida]KAK0560937.1 hypothetical protein OC844_003489 [Tilletia horrida]
MASSSKKSVDVSDCAAEDHLAPSSELRTNDAAPASTSTSSHSQRASDILLTRTQYRRFKLAYSAVQFGSGIAFSPFLTYVPFQLQLIAYVIGHEPGMAPGSGCSLTATSCRVPFAGSGDVNLTSFINYINAISYAVSGALALIVSGLGDRMSFQREQFIFFLFGYGALCTPFAGLTATDLPTFNAYAGLYVVFNIFGFLVQVWAKIFIPYLMYAAEESPGGTFAGSPAALESEDDGTSVWSEKQRREQRERAGLSMNLWGGNALNSSQIIIIVIAIGVTYVSALYAGLYMTTAGGIVCAVLALVAGPFLPAPSRRHSTDLDGTDTGKSTWARLLMSPLHTFWDLLNGLRSYPEAFKFLLAYTIYTDTTFAFASVTGQLFTLNVRPSTREFSAYSIVGPATSIFVATTFVQVFPVLQRRLGLTLRWWTALAYGINLFVALWACIGISEHAQVGFKHRWEFYVMSIVQSTGGAIANLVFTVLFAQLFPRGHELEYFGFQLVLSCSTVWIPQIVNGPIVDATNNLRLPAIVSVATFLIAIVLVAFTNDTKGVQQIINERTQVEAAETVESS